MVRQGAVQYMKERGYESFTLEEVSIIVKQSRSTLYRAIDRGDLVVVKVGGSPRVRHADLQAYLQMVGKSS